MKKLLLLLLLVLLVGCGSSGKTDKIEDHYRNVYVPFLYSFYDTTGDGVGDIQGLIKQLDYISCPETGLGADAIWMLPIHPATSYHGYDVTDYKEINPLHGTLDDFDQLVAAANKRGVILILDLIMNHTSIMHPWFTAALQEIREDLPYHYFYYYNIVEGKPPGSSWYSAGKDYFYEGDFWAGMPDLNFNNPEVKREFEEIVRFWIDRGIRGFRLDAAKHIFHTERENIAFWTWFSEMVHEIDPDIFLVAEVWDADVVVMPYYETGLTSMFNFRFEGAGGVISQAIRNQSGASLPTEIFRMDRHISGRNPDSMSSIFISNHDTNRSADWLRVEEERKIAAAAYLFIPGVSYIYYGEEIAMTGTGRDENKRAPMIWSLTRQAGETRGPRAMDRIPDLGEGVEEALLRPDSLLNYYREIIAIKNRHPEIARGTPEEIKTDIVAVAMYSLTWNEKTVYIVHNFSTEAVTVAVDVGSRVKIAENLNPNCTEGSGFGLSNGELTLPRYGTAVLR
ncbi:MAG: alpha amylase [Lachnospiraceae bacterium]|jgi:glycosidase|nr:alpha amylase [Lachnospiraceae bacterium]